MNVIDRHITATMTGMLTALLLISFVLYQAAKDKSSQCTIETTKGQVTVVRIGQWS